MIKIINAFVVFLLLFCVFPVISEENTVRIERLLNEQWTFNYFPEGYKQKYPSFNDKRWDKPQDSIWSTFIESPKFDDSTWSIVSIPHTWSTFETTGEIHPYIKNPSPKDDTYWWNGTGWYRKRFVINKKFLGKKVFIEFEGVQKNCRIYLNGKPIDEHFGGYTGFCCDLTDFIRFAEENILVVSVSNKQEDDFKVAPMNGGCWNVYGGIYRNVKLVITDKLYIPYQGSARYEGGTFITTPVVASEKAGLNIRTWIKNEYPEPKECTLVTKIIDKNGEIVTEIKLTKTILSYQTELFLQNTEIKNPFLWDINNPNMYLAVSEVLINNQVVDRYKTHFGIREFRWDFETNTLFLNGQKVNIQGFNRHQEYPWLGDAIPDFIHKMDLLDIKENLNCNFVRPGQYISSPYVYDLCDSIGLITCGEFPNVKDLDFSIAMQENYAREVVRQYRNHPSILLWDVGDETNRAADSRWVYEEDNTRYISCRDCAGPTSGKYISLPSKNFRLAKMLNCNIRGWYDDDEMNSRPDNQQHVTNEQYRHEVARTSKDGTSNNRIDQPNLVVWLYEDHGCDREYQNAPLLHFNPKGWVDSYRVPKFVYYLWQANYSTKPMIFIHPQFWREKYIGQKKNIEVDSNCDSVKLLINNRNFGILIPNAANFHVVKFSNVPIEKGTLTAIGYKNGEEVIQELKMTGVPAKIVLKSSHTQIIAKRSSIAIISADITDIYNNHIYGAKNTVKWEVSGPATLVGAPIYQSDFDKRMEKNGTLYIDMPVSNIIRSTGEAGIITVRLYAAGLKIGEVKIQAIKNAEDMSDEISEPVLSSKGRLKVIQNPKEISLDNTIIPLVIRKFSSDIKLPKNQKIDKYVSLLNQILKKNNPQLNTKTSEYTTFLNVIAKATTIGNGYLSVFELNYNIDNFNRYSCLKKIVDETKLPERFKTDLKDFYIKDLIVRGNEINIENVKSKLSSIPANAVVIIPGIKGKDSDYITIKSMDINKIMSTINQKFNLLKDEEKEKYLKYLSEINPWIKRNYMITGDAKLGTRKEIITYELTSGKAIIVPEIK